MVLANNGSGALTISAVTLGGASAADFAVQPLALPITLAPGGLTTVEVEYEPTVVGASIAALDVSSDDPSDGTLALPLSGSGVSPGFAIAPSTIDFGGELVNRESSPRQATLTNTGTGNLSVTSLVIAGGGSNNSAVYALANPPALPAVIARRRPARAVADRWTRPRWA